MVWGLDMRFLGGKREKINQGGVNSNRIIQMESCCFSVVSFPVLGFSVLLMATDRGGVEMTVSGVTETRVSSTYFEKKTFNLFNV